MVVNWTNVTICSQLTYFFANLFSSVSISYNKIIKIFHFLALIEQIKYLSLFGQRKYTFLLAINIVTEPVPHRYGKTG